jgi:flotillin
MAYTIASPDEYLAITGAGIKSIKITKSAWVWPFQRVSTVFSSRPLFFTYRPQCQRFSIQPHDYNLALQTMTREKLQFLLPVVFTVGPDVGNPQAAKDNTANVENNEVSPLEKYAMLLADGKTKNGSHVQNIIKGIIEGETRVLVSSMTMEEIFAERDAFKKRVFNNIQAELDQFGLKVYNAKVKELGSEFLSVIT